MHSKGHDDQVMLYALDLIELDVDGWRPGPLKDRKKKLAKLLSRAQDGILTTSTSTNRTVRSSSNTACRLGFEGIVSKQRDFPYRCGRTKSWIKVKNPASPAMLRVQDGTF